MAGLAAGGAGAALGAIVSLLVRSPDPDVANTATVAVIALLVGIAAGISWWAAGPRAETTVARAIWGGGGWIAAIAVMAFFDRGSLDGLVGYGIVPATVVFAVVPGTAPWFGRDATRSWIKNVSVMVAIVAGAFLAGLS